MIVRKKCKESFKLDLYQFEFGKWYIFHINKIINGSKIEVIYYDEENNLPIMYEKTANQYFYSDKELRQIKIKKII